MKCLPLLLVWVAFANADPNTGYSPDVSVCFQVNQHLTNAIIVSKKWAISTAHTYKQLKPGSNIVVRYETVSTPSNGTQVLPNNVTGSDQNKNATNATANDVDNYDETYRRVKRSFHIPWMAHGSKEKDEHDSFFGADDGFFHGHKKAEGEMNESKSEEEEEEEEYGYDDKDKNGEDEEEGKVKIKKKKSKHQKINYGKTVYEPTPSPNTTTTTPNSTTNGTLTNQTTSSSGSTNSSNATSIPSTPLNAIARVALEVIPTNQTSPVIPKNTTTTITIYDYKTYWLYYNDETKAPVESVGIIEIIIYESYRAESDGTYTNDIALLKLEDSGAVSGDEKFYPGVRPQDTCPYYISWVKGTPEESQRVALWRCDNDIQGDEDDYDENDFQHLDAFSVQALKYYKFGAPFQAGGSIYKNGSALGLYSYTNKTSDRYFFIKVFDYRQWIMAKAKIDL